MSPLRLSPACHPIPQSPCHLVKSMNPTQSVQTYLTTAAESAFVGQAVDMIEHWQGQENLLWRVEAGGREAVVKLYIDAGQVRSRRQYDGQERFFRFGAAPRPLWFDWQPDGLTRPVLVYEWMPGEPLRSDDSTALRASARLLAQVHSADTDGLDRFSPHPISLDYQWRLLRTSIGNINVWLTVSEASDLRAAFAELADRAKTLVEQALPLWQGLLPAPVHGDVRLENMIEAFGDVTFLDWELFGLGDPALEVARFLHMNQADLSEDVRGDWLDELSEQRRTTGDRDTCRGLSAIAAVSVHLFSVGWPARSGRRLRCPGDVPGEPAFSGVDAVRQPDPGVTNPRRKR